DITSPPIINPIQTNGKPTNNVRFLRGKSYTMHKRTSRKHKKNPSMIKQIAALNVLLIKKK
ncbi:hypothetical protein, partial [Klebsiella pneumoniae]